MLIHSVDSLTPTATSPDDVRHLTSRTDAIDVAEVEPVRTDHAPATTERTIKALAVVQLSAHGRRASLLAGGDGHALQRLHVDVPPSAADLVRVNRRGEASLVLGPRIVVQPNGRLRRLRDPMLYDAPPTNEQLLVDARAIAALRQAYVTQRSLAYTAAKEAVAQEFLQDAARRAIVHPPPTAQRCAFRTEHGVLVFRHTDAGAAAVVPVEAHRRFRGDLAERARRNQSQAARDMAIHQAKHLSMARWIEQHGSADQQTRLAAGRLSDAEMYEAIADEVYGPLREWPRYLHDARGDLLTCYREVDASAPGDIPAAQVKVESTVVVHLSAEQWRQLAAMQAAVPEAVMTVRQYRIYWSDRPARHDPHVIQYAVLVKYRIDPLTIVRSYMLPAPDGSTADSTTARGAS
jgi:hypothetical protein